MKLNLRDVSSTDVGFMREHYAHKYDLHQINTPSVSNDGIESGEHYKLINYIANRFENKTILDIGTRDGMSALAMAPSPNTIVTYDILNVNLPFLDQYSNVKFKQLDINAEDKENLLASPFMLLDIDPHDGRQETVFFQRLRDIGYQGIIVMDDIHLNPPMQAMWDAIPEDKQDVTAYGHGSGTGIVDFSGELEV